MRLRVGIVGAGLAGLATARALKAAGHQATIFEKSDHVGGRVATRNIGGYVFDSGASDIVPRGHPLEEVMLKELDTSELVTIEKPIYMHQALRPTFPESSRAQPKRYTYISGNNKLPQMLAEGLDVRLRSTVEGLEKSPASYKVLGEEFDAVVLTAPIPQTATILWTISESRPFANCRYRPCLSVMLGFAKQAPDVHYHALLDPEQRHPLMWLSIESIKCPRRAAEGHTAMVAQLSPAYSLTNFAADEQRVIGDVLDYVARLYGQEWNGAEVAQVKRWKYALPDSVSLFDTVNDPSQRVIIAGDGVLAGRTESAYDTGLRAAALLMAATGVKRASASS
ncbi:MAG: renalase [Fimbriimonadaceae bacterium]|jgi:predicted NAD/FAD-dependent oxidoreductase|nr:renalase [Fimbriimonadaceae bacterium]